MENSPRVKIEMELARPVEPAGASNRRLRIVAVAFFALAAACVVGTALQGGDGARSVSLYLGASEEKEAGKVGQKAPPCRA